jgi:CHAD domain-containing protein
MENENNISLLQYYNRYFASFCIQFGKPKLRLSKKVIHQLRVDIKNMRAIFELLKVISNESWMEEKNINVFDKLFQAAGNVREEQVNLSIVNQYTYSSSLSLFKKYLIKRKRSAFWTLHKALNNFNLVYNQNGIQENKSHVESNYQSEIIHQAQSFIQKGIKRIKKLYPEISSKNLHNIRKEIKNISTIAIFYYEISPNKKLAKISDKIKSLERLMGVWHNRVVLQSSIKQFLTKDESFPEVLMLNNLIRLTKKQNTKTVKQIEKRMGKLVG